MRLCGKIRPSRLTTQLVFALASTCVVAIVVAPSRADATARAAATPLEATPLPERVAGIVERVAKRYGVEIDQATVVAAPAASDTAGVVVASGGGADRIAPYSSEGMMGFASVERVRAHGDAMVFASAAPLHNGQTRSSIVGVTAPHVDAVTITLASGAELEVELVAAGRSGFRFFAYATESTAAAPASYIATSADGEVVAREDLASAFATPSATGG